MYGLTCSPGEEAALPRMQEGIRHWWRRGYWHADAMRMHGWDRGDEYCFICPLASCSCIDLQGWILDYSYIAAVSVYHVRYASWLPIHYGFPVRK